VDESSRNNPEDTEGFKIYSEDERAGSKAGWDYEPALQFKLILDVKNIVVRTENECCE
jgi:hypothetical protein